MGKDGFSKDRKALHISRKSSLWTLLGLVAFGMARLVAKGPFASMLLVVGCVFWFLVIASFVQMARYKREYKASHRTPAR
jgi:hypothetical protein